MRNFETVRFLKFENFIYTFGKNVFFTFLKSFTIFFGVNQQSWVFLESSHPKQSPCGVLLCSRQVAIIRFFPKPYNWTKLENCINSNRFWKNLIIVYQVQALTKGDNPIELWCRRADPINVFLNQ